MLHHATERRFFPKESGHDCPVDETTAAACAKINHNKPIRMQLTTGLQSKPQAALRASQGFIFSASLLLFFGCSRKLWILFFFGRPRMLFLLLFFGCLRMFFSTFFLLHPFLMCLECFLPAFATSRKLIPWLKATITHCASWMVAMIRKPLPRHCSQLPLGMC